jgi:hypothetical protein
MKKKLSIACHQILNYGSGISFIPSDSMSILFFSVSFQREELLICLNYWKNIQNKFPKFPVSLKFNRRSIRG